MRERIPRFGGGKRRRRLLVAVVASVAALGVFAITNALAVHDEVFQLDGDVDSTTQTHVGVEGDPPVAKTQTLDWDNFFGATGNELSLPTNFDASGFDRDFQTNQNGSFNTSDSTTFATGSKDTLPITPGWQCNLDNNVNSKTDVMNAYATSYTDPDSGDELLYFALERNANTGTGNVGFWFLQDAVACESSGGTAAFSGDHTDGDILIVSEFSSGGRVSTIFAYEWEGGANGSLNPNAVAQGADCPGTSGGDTICAIANETGIKTPWPTSNKQDGPGDDLRVAEFFEGGINLTEEGLSGRCFNTFIADTRSSTSLTATIFDFSLGALGSCDTDLITTPKQADGTTNIPAVGLTIPGSGTILVKDSAAIDVTGADTFSGELTFHLCGPIASGTCATGGVAIGSAQTITGDGTYVSDAATVTERGRYCWRADFASDTDGVPDASDSSTGECFLINPRQPTISTDSGGDGTTPIPFGQAVTDVATLGNTANRPGSAGPNTTYPSINPTVAGTKAKGTITFTLLKADCSTPATGTGTNPQTVNVDGDGTYSVSFTPDAPGQYYWKATYSGDLPNTLASLASASPCPDASESVVVQQIPTQISTTQKVFPQDSATVTSSQALDNLPSGGTVTFRLYQAGGGNTALQNCQAHGTTLNSGGLIYEKVRTGLGGTNSFTTATDNTTVAVDASGSYYWWVTYVPGDTAHTGRQSNCQENTVLTFNNDAGPGTLFTPAP